MVKHKQAYTLGSRAMLAPALGGLERSDRFANRLLKIFDPADKSDV